MNNKEKYPITRYVSFERVVREKVKASYYHIPENIKSPEDAADTIQGIYDIGKETQEIFGILCLNQKMKVIATEVLHKGTANASIVHPRDVFRYALTSAPTVSIMVFHNHPSGNTAPSQEDIQVTRRLKEAGQMLGVEVLDHLIVSDEGYTSLKEKGYL